MEPARLNRVEPGALDRQEAGQNANASTSGLCPLIVSTNPGAHLRGEVPRGVIPDQEPEALAEAFELGGTVLKKRGGNSAHRAPRDEAEPDLLWQGGQVGRTGKQETITGQCLGIRVIFGEGLFDQAYAVKKRRLKRPVTSS